VGVASFGIDPVMSYATLVSEADTAMYAAKDGGGDGFRVFHPDAIRVTAPGRS
jgi:GGDEF domain-containing protein